MINFEVFFDGACEPKNPGGHLGYGYLIYQDGDYILSDSFYEPKSSNNTNNVAEYKACLEALHRLLQYVSIHSITEYSVSAFGDSMLVVKQMNGVWNINSGAYKEFALKTKSLIEDFENIKFNWIPREQNQDADDMSKQELKKRGVEENKWQK